MKINTEKLNAILKERGWSPSDYARAMKAERQWVYDILSGKAGQTFKTTERLADALGLKGTDIIEN